jgi:hypothetical protein
MTFHHPVFVAFISMGKWCRVHSVFRLHAGVLSFGFQSVHRQDFHQAPLLQSQERLASAMAEQVGLTLENLRLRETLSMQAIRDPLTDRSTVAIWKNPAIARLIGHCAAIYRWASF